MLRFEHEFIEHVKHHDKGLLDSIAETLKFDDDQEAKAVAAYDSFVTTFETSEGKGIHVGHEADVDPTADDELGQEQIVKQKRG